MSIEFDNDEQRAIAPLHKFLPKVITGGKGPPSSPNWLRDLEVGDIFLARHIREADKNFELNLFRVILKLAKSTKLMVQISEDQKMYRWVDTATFSREMIFNEVIGNASDGEVTFDQTAGE